MLVHTPFISLISWFVMWLTSHAVILCVFVTLNSCFIKWLKVCHVNSYSFYHTAFVASLGASPFVLFTTSLLNWVPHHLYCKYTFYHTAFFALLCASPLVLILRTPSITLPSLLRWVPHHLYCSYPFYHTAFLLYCVPHHCSVTLLSLLYCVPRHLYWYFVPVLSHCLRCFVECLTICTVHTRSIT